MVKTVHYTAVKIVHYTAVKTVHYTAVKIVKIKNGTLHFSTGLGISIF